MLSEGFLRMQPYREERTSPPASQRYRMQTRTLADALESDSTGQRQHSAQTGPNREVQDSSQAQGLKVDPPGSVGVSIPGCSPALTLTLDADLTVCGPHFSFLEQYPDLQVADVSQNFTSTDTQDSLYDYHPEQSDPVPSIPDQGYLVMGDSVSVSLYGSGVEPMSNSVLNGLLEKQLEEVYMQHLTDNLARCNSHQENSLLRGLEPPPQPCSQHRGPDSLEVSLQVEGTERKISYLNTHTVPCSSNFSSPLLRISEADQTHLK